MNSQLHNTLFYKNSMTGASGGHLWRQFCLRPDRRHAAGHLVQLRDHLHRHPAGRRARTALDANSRRRVPPHGSTVNVPFTIYDSGTSALSWTASSNQSWLTLSAASGTAPIEGNSAITLYANPSTWAMAPTSGPSP